MNTNNIKRYAPKARTAFIAAMTKQAAKYGITSKGIEPLEQKGDLALIGDRPFTADIIRPRAALVKKVEQMGFAQAMDQAAYSWFNRLCAIRFMEIKGYIDHGRRVLSHPEREGSFQILDDCLDIQLEGLDSQRIKELKLDGTKDEELYRELLLTQCHALHQAMPFLFEAIDDATELLLPDNLTKTDSLIRELVNTIPEEDWQNVEIIGWLYQFYISEKKDQVIGKEVKSEDIPAATQLFTPNWIVQYLVQNSVGRQWLETYPDSQLKGKMPYYIEQAEQTTEVQAQLAAITPDNIDPLSIKVLDPACGSGHILVEAYKVLKAIYEERGFRSRDIPQLILENNLFGLDIDDRAGQLAGFALMMLAREDDRRIFSRVAENGFKLNVLALQESHHLDFVSLWEALNLTSDWQRGQSQRLFNSEQRDLDAAIADNRYKLLKNTLARFYLAKTFGSLIEVPTEDAEPLKELLEQLRQLANEGDSMQKPAAEQLIPYVQQAWVLAQRYDAVVANPPYMGRRGMPKLLKEFIAKNYPNAIWDIYAAFIERAVNLAKEHGMIAKITMHSWMFLTAFESLRSNLITKNFLISMLHLGTRAFNEIGGEVVQTCAFIITKNIKKNTKCKFFDLTSENSSDQKNITLLNHPIVYKNLSSDDFSALPSASLSYWASKEIIELFKNKKIGEITLNKSLNLTGDNERFLRFHWEIDSNTVGKSKKWIFYAKGGKYKKWYGNFDYTINWSPEAITFYRTDKTARIIPEELWWKKGITWTKVTTGNPGFRLLPEEATYDVGGSSIIIENNETLLKLMGFLNTPLATHMIRMLNTSVNIQVGDIESLPLIIDSIDSNLVQEAIDITKSNWDSKEISFDFKCLPLKESNKTSISALLSFEKTNYNIDRLFNIENQITTQVERSLHLEKFRSTIEKSEITLESNFYQSLPNAEANEIKPLYFSEFSLEIISYFIGCIMGRYSLDSKGLVYARTSNQGFDELVAEGAYKTFPADGDGILPLTDQEWFPDDATDRFREFVCTVWGEEHLQENLDFIAESLCLSAIKSKRGESALDTIRRYLSTQFYKDHLKTYKKRPIYWLFSSGKHKAFECLVYLHRYHEGTLARMRTEYVIPLTAKLNTYANKLEQDIDASTSTAEKKRLEKELDTLHKQQAELATFDEKLRHFADQRISLDLDDGVKVNYGKFGDLLAEVKAITGEKSE